MTIWGDSKIALDKAKEAISKNKYLVRDDSPIKTLKDEYNMFINFYSNEKYI